MILWRPVGMRELALIWEMHFRGFPPRLPQQPIFYPVLNEEYATQIAQRWNTKDEPFAGYVTRFEVADHYARQFETQVVGDRRHQEFWIDAADLRTFNSHLEGPITVEAAYFGSRFRGHVPHQFGLARLTAVEQFRALSDTRDYARMDFHLEIVANSLTVYLNFPFWRASDAPALGVSDTDRDHTLEGIRRVWSLSSLPGRLIESGTRVA